MNTPKIRVVKIKDIKKAAYNPPDRAKKAVESVLRTSLEEKGLQQPLLITRDNGLVDGHRRLACLEAMGWEEVPCIETLTPQAEAYSAVNTTMIKMTGNDVLHIYYHSPEALTTIQRGNVERAITTVGEDLVKELYENDYTLRMVSSAARVSAYCGKESKRFMQQTVKWLMKFGANQLQSAMDVKTPAHTIIDAITSKKALKITVSSVE